MSAAELSTPAQSLPLATMPTIMSDLGEMERYGWIGSAYLVTHSAVCLCMLLSLTLPKGRI